MRNQPITITIGGLKDEAATSFPAEAFAGIPLEFDATGEKPQFVVGIDATGIVRRLVSQSTAERHVVAAIVGTWVAAGLRVQHVEGFVALAKMIRKAAGAEKESEATDPDPARGGAPLQNGVDLMSTLVAGLSDIQGVDAASVDPNAILDHLSAENYYKVATDGRLRAETKDGMMSFLRSMGFADSQPFEKQPALFHQQYGFAAASAGAPLQASRA